MVSGERWRTRVSLTKSDAPKQGVRQAQGEQHAASRAQALGFTAPAAAAAVVKCTDMVYMKYKLINKIVTAHCCLLHAACRCLPLLALHAARFYGQVHLVFILGVNHCEGQRLRLEHYLSCLYDDVIPETINRGFKLNKKRRLAYYEIAKKGLNNIFLKYDVQDDLITCKPIRRNGKVL